MCNHFENGTQLPYLDSWIIHENKWRAAQKGVTASLIDFGLEREVSFETLISEMLEFVDEIVDDLDIRKYIKKNFLRSNK